MRIIKLGIISFVFFFLLITGFSLFIPSRVRISRALNTGVTTDSLFRKYVADLSRWKYWNPGFDSVSLAGNAEADGRLTIAHVGTTDIRLTMTGDSLVTVTYEAPGKRPITETFRKIEHPQQDSVIIQWYKDFKLRWYPWEKFSGLTFEKRYGSVMEEGLSRLAGLPSTRN